MERAQRRSRAERPRLRLALHRLPLDIVGIVAMTPERQASWFLHLFDRRPTNDVECYVVPYRRRRVSARATWHAYSYELCRFSLMETVKSTDVFEDGDRDGCLVTAGASAGWLSDLAPRVQLCAVTSSHRLGGGIGRVTSSACAEQKNSALRLNCSR